MRQYQNIFEIWIENNQKVPFKVRHFRWAEWRSVEIVRVGDVSKGRNGKPYGKAWTRDEWYWKQNSKYNTKDEKFVQLCGCFGWIKIDYIM